MFTQLTIPEVRKLFRTELEAYFAPTGQKKIENSESDEFFETEGAAEFLGYAVPTIYLKVRRRELPFSKRGKRLYFSKKELIEWIKAGRIKTAAEIAEEAESNLPSRKGRPNA